MPPKGWKKLPLAPTEICTVGWKTSAEVSLNRAHVMTEDDEDDAEREPKRQGRESTRYGGMARVHHDALALRIRLLVRPCLSAPSAGATASERVSVLVLATIPRWLKLAL